MAIKNVAILLFPDVLMLDVAGPVEVFSIANRYLSADDHYKICTVAAGAREILCSNGIVMQAEQLIGESPANYNIVLVPGGPGAYNESHPDVLDWLREAARTSCCYGSVCTGAFILGEAGLLDGHRVTTHWNYHERLARRYPKAIIETEQIFLRDRKLISSGGVTAAIDLALSLLAEDHGKKIALDVAKVLLVVMKRQGGQAQFSPLMPILEKSASPIAFVRDYVIEHIEEAFSVERLAELANMSPRNFARVFARDMEMPPMEFVLSARLDSARNLLESTDLPFKTVAFRSGFGSTRQMRAQFQQRLGLTPVQYRHQFG